MSKYFTINVGTGTDSAFSMTMSATDGLDMMDAALKLSFAYDSWVTVTMFSVLRRKYEKGVIVADHPDIHDHFDEATDQQKKEWSGYGEL